jgi:hypothetical protein
MMNKVIILLGVGLILVMFHANGQDVYHLTACIGSSDVMQQKRILIYQVSKGKYMVDIDTVNECIVASDFYYRLYSGDTLYKPAFDSILYSITDLNFRTNYISSAPMTMITLFIFNTSVIRLTYRFALQHEEPDSPDMKLFNLLQRLDKKSEQ